MGPFLYQKKCPAFIIRTAIRTTGILAKIWEKPSNAGRVQQLTARVVGCFWLLSYTVHTDPPTRRLSILFRPKIGVVLWPSKASCPKLTGSYSFSTFATSAKPSTVNKSVRRSVSAADYARVFPLQPLWLHTDYNKHIRSCPPGGQLEWFPIVIQPISQNQSAIADLFDFFF